MTPEQIEIIRTSLLGLDPSLIPGDLRTLLLADINSVLTEVGGLGFTESIDQSIGGGSSGGGGGRSCSTRAFQRRAIAFWYYGVVLV